MEMVQSIGDDFIESQESMTVGASRGVYRFMIVITGMEVQPTSIEDFNIGQNIPVVSTPGDIDHCMGGIYAREVACLEAVLDGVRAGRVSGDLVRWAFRSVPWDLRELAKECTEQSRVVFDSLMGEL